MTHQFELHYDKQLIRQVVARYWWRVVGVRYLIALAALAVGLVMLVIGGDRSWTVGALAAVLAMGVSFMIAVYVVHYRNAMAKLEAMHEPVATFIAAEPSFTVSSGAGSSTLPWSAVTELWRYPRFWLMSFSKAQFITIPLESVTPEAQAFLLDRIRDCGGVIC